MKFCTIADKNYLTKALAMYQSLIENLEQFTLYFLCLDDETFLKLEQLELPNLYIVRLALLESLDIELRNAKNNQPSKYGTQYSQYCWCLTPYFTNYILTNYCKKNEYLTYVDSDIYFYGSPKKIIEEMKGMSVGIHTHRFTPPIKETDSGWYNVGIVVFKNDTSGLFISSLWKYWLLNPKNEFYNKYGTCGDQKYLELFEKICDSVCIFDKNILHSAPWCCNDLSGKDILWYHFSHFTINGDTYKDHINAIPEWQPTLYKWIKPLYDNYFKVIKKAENIISD